MQMQRVLHVEHEHDNDMMDWLNQYVDWPRVLRECTDVFDLFALADVEQDVRYRILYEMAQIVARYHPISAQEEQAWELLIDCNWAALNEVGRAMLDEGEAIMKANEEAWLRKWNNHGGGWVAYAPIRHAPADYDLRYWFSSGVRERGFSDVLSVLWQRLPEDERDTIEREQLLPAMRNILGVTD